MKKGFQSISIMFKYAKIPAILTLVLMLLSSGFASLQMLITQRLVDGVAAFAVDGAALQTVYIWVFFSFCSIIFSSSNEYFNTLINISIDRNLLKNFMPMLMHKLKKTEYSCFENPDTHNLISRMSQTPQLSVVNCFNSLIALMTSIFSMCGIIIYFFTVSIRFTIIYIIITLIYCALMAARTKKTFNMWDKMEVENRRMNYLNSLLIQKHSLTELRIFGGTAYILKKWQSYLSLVLNNFLKQSLKTQSIQIANNIILCFWAGFMLFSAGSMVVNGMQSAGFFIAILTGIGNISNLTAGLSYNYNDYINSTLTFGYYKDFMELPETAKAGDSKDADNIEIKFENVYFKYPQTDIPILNGVSFALNQNERVSIVGKNGAGKSTIIKLLCGLYKPDSGKIYIGGRELSEIKPEAARRIFSVVFQDFGQYSFTLRENVALSNIGYINDDKKIIDALKLGMGEELINKSPLGLDTPLGKLEDDGTDLSGGQWQRISIARAFFSDSKFVVLDEPTASLDPLAECRMYETFLSVLKNKGSITISHRLASAKMADRILVISDGRITEEGSHDALMKLNGEYCRMFTSQASWYSEGGADYAGDA